MRINILLACSECKRRNYATQKNKKNTTAKIDLSKFCPFCGKHTSHRESKQYESDAATAASDSYLNNLAYVEE